MTATASSRYDGEPVSVKFTHGEWSLLLSCAEKRRRDVHDRADRLELDDPEKYASQIVGLRRKATALFVLTESIQATMAAARTGAAQARESGAT